MANVRFDKKTFEKEIGKLDDKLQERISLFGTPVEEVTNDEVEIEVFPNRPDMLSYHGFKRSFLAFMNKKTGLKQYKLNKPEKDYDVIVDSSVNSVRPFTTCAIIKGLKLGDKEIKELIDVQEKIHSTMGRKRKKVAIGIYPLDKIKLPIKFKAMAPDKIKFVPLESDSEMTGNEILEKHPTGQEYKHLLEGMKSYPVFADSNNEILSMPPVINSVKTGKIDSKTRNVFVECSGHDFETLKKALNILVTTMADMGGKIYQMNVKYKKKEVTPDFTPDEMKISVENANKHLGLNLTEKEIKKFLERMGYNYVKGKVKIPAWRNDVLHEVDLIEDIAIAYGYENFVPVIPEISTIGEESKREIVKRKVSEIFSGIGMLEVSNYHLTNRQFQFKKMGIQEQGVVEVEESKTDYNILRQDLSHYMLKILSENNDAEYPQKIFEIGKVFRGDEKISENENLACAVSSGNYTDMKQIIEYFGKMIGVKLSVEEASEEIPSYFIDGRTATVKFKGKEIGFIGEIHPKILRNWKIKMPVALFEIDFNEILEKV